MKQKIIFWLLLGAGTTVAATAVGLRALFTMNLHREYVPASELAKSAEIQRVIAKSVRITPDFTLATITERLTARAFESGGQKFIVYRFNFPNKTCGKAGCLYVVTSADGRTMPLQLFELPAGGNLFQSIAKIGCFNVLQPNSKKIEDYEICQPN
jgi:hypothetical protein